MLDGRALGASQVEYKPFGKPSKERGRSSDFSILLDLVSLGHGLARMTQFCNAAPAHCVQPHTLAILPNAWCADAAGVVTGANHVCDSLGGLASHPSFFALPGLQTRLALAGHMPCSDWDGSIVMTAQCWGQSRITCSNEFVRLLSCLVQRFCCLTTLHPAWSWRACRSSFRGT